MVFPSLLGQSAWRTALKIGIFLLFFLTASCAPRTNVFDEYLSGVRATDIDVQGENAATLFEGAVPQDLPEKTVVFYTDGACSVCIASVIQLYTAFRESRTDYSLLVLLDGPNQDLFDFYWKKNFSDEPLAERVQILLSPKTLDTPRGFYVVDGNVVNSFSIWTEN